MEAIEKKGKTAETGPKPKNFDISTSILYVYQMCHQDVLPLSLESLESCVSKVHHQTPNFSKMHGKDNK